MFIYFDTDSAQEPEIAKSMQKAAELCAQAEGLDPSDLSVSVTFVDTEEIRRLNLEYRQKDESTDVLSFPQFESLSDLRGGGEINLGDVVICRAVAEEQAREYGHSPERELLYLFTHSMFHLLGYDHLEEDQRRAMRLKEEAVMEQMRLSRKDMGGDNLG